MPSTPYARIRIRVNGGAPQTGRVVVSAGDTIQLEAESYDGWGAPVARWEWYSFPDDWTGPGGFWSSENIPQADGSLATVYFWLGNSQPPSFTAPAIELWGKYLPRLIVNGGEKGGGPSADVIDQSTLMEIVSPTGLHDLAWLEGNQAGQEKKWSRDHQENLRTVDTAVGAAATPYGSTPAVVASGAGSAGAAAAYARGDHSHQLTNATLNTILAASVAPIDINGQTLTGGGVITPYVQSSAANPATTGLLRGVHNSVIVASKDNAGTDNVPLVSYGVDGADVLTLGDAVIPGMRLRAASGRVFEFYSDAQLLYTLAQNSISVSATHTFLFTQTTGVGAGATATIKAQDGAATFAGGKLVVSAGAPGAGGAPTGVDIELEDSTTVSGTLSVKGGAFGDLVTVQYDDATGFTTLGISGPDDALIETKELIFKAQNAALFATTNGLYGGGQGVLYMPDATTAPTTDIITGIGVYTSSDALRVRNHALTVLAPKVESAPGNEDLRAPDRRASRTTTTNATPTDAYTFVMPDESVAFFRVEVLAFRAADGTSAVYELKAGVKCNAGVASLIGAVDVFAREDNAALDATIAVDGTQNVYVVVTGVAAQTHQWFVTLNITLMQPAP